MNKISVAIPTYNRKEYLRDCIESILKQTFSDFNIYIFDNCSDYDIEKFVQDFNDSRIKLIKSPHNIGNLKNFERIFAYNFDSEYLVVFHDDDTMHTEFLESNCKILNTNEDAVFSASSMTFVKRHETIQFFAKLNKPLKTLRGATQRDFVKLLLTNFNLCFGSVVYRLKFINKNFGLLAEKYDKWVDRPYLVELSDKGPVIIIDEKLVNYRLHENQDSQTHSIDKSRELLSLFTLYKNIYLNKDHSKKDRKIFYAFSTNFILLSGLSFTENFAEYKHFIVTAKANDLFKISYLNFKGMWYVLLATKRLFIKK